MFFKSMRHDKNVVEVAEDSFFGHIVEIVVVVVVWGQREEAMIGLFRIPLTITVYLRELEPS